MNQVMDEIIGMLYKLDIQLYTIRETTQESVELYFVKKDLNMKRINNVTDYVVTVYRDFEKDGKKMRGSSSTTIYITMNIEEMESALSSAYYAASFVNNPFYELPTGTKENCITAKTQLAAHRLEENAMIMVQALYEADIEESSFINSSEFFSTRTKAHIINSNGIDVSYQKDFLSGEFVVQCTTPQDVELYKCFAYTDLVPEAIAKLSSDTIQLAKSRAIATLPPKTGVTNVILSGQTVAILLSYYTNRSSSDFIYPGYSNYKVGENVQSKDVNGELLNITMKSTAPYTRDGIAMPERPLITNGILQTIQGDSMYAYYLGIPAIGTYDSFILQNGTISQEDMKQGSYLQIEYFSDFQIDSLSGDFGGEIRLAFYCDGKNVIPVTGGSISGNINNYHDQLYFSKEQQTQSFFSFTYLSHINYEGPNAILLKGVNVSGN